MRVLNICGVEIFSSVYEYLDSNMYVFFPCERTAIIIDPHKDEDCLGLLKQRKTKRVVIILTHEHTDHTSGLYWFQERFECELICQKECAAYLSNKRSMRPLLTYLILEEKDHREGTHLLEKFKKEYVIRTYEADKTFNEHFEFRVGNFDVLLKHIPGHSKGSSMIVINSTIVFTGDSLMKVNPVITRFPGSDHNQYIENTLPKLSALNPEMTILPGHGNPFVLKELVVNGKLNIEYK